MGSSKQGGWQANGQAPHAKEKKYPKTSADKSFKRQVQDV